MIPKPIDAITPEDLASLQQNQVAEGKTLEYKSELPGDTAKLLRVICAFANTMGGDLLYGVEAAKGIPTGIPGLEILDEDGLRQRIENACRDSIEPRLPHLQFQFIPLATGRKVLLVRVPRSWNSPHRLKRDGHFYGRNSAGCYLLDVGEIRQSFAMSDSVAERIRGFRADRLIHIQGNVAPVALTDAAAKLVFHIVPLASFLGPAGIDIDREEDLLRKLQPLGTGGWNHKRNLDGYVTYTGRNAREPSRSYCQIFRSGIVEAVDTYMPGGDGERIIWAANVELTLLEALPRYLQILSQLSVNFPYYLFLSLCGVTGYELHPGRFRPSFERPFSDRDMLLFEEQVLVDHGSDAQEAIKNLMSLLWNAFGMARPEAFDPRRNL